MQLTDADAAIRSQLRDAPGWDGVRRLGVAVSGGGDSMALLHLLTDCAATRGVTLRAATVDHGLRPEAAAEAAFVAETCAGLGVAHETLPWRGWDGRGNLQAEARAARYRLLADWARREGLDAVALGHTRDDQAETFLMRLAREAGVDGLAAMAPRFERAGAVFWRPLLALDRAGLRDFLLRRGAEWRDDPSNEDPGFDRVRARRALAALAPLGLDAGHLAGVAANMSAARAALRHATCEAAQRLAREERGDVVIARDGFLGLPVELRRRLLAAAIGWIAGGGYAPRREGLADLLAAVGQGRTHTLAGCLVTVEGDALRLAREHNAVKAITAAPGEIWDGRWRLTGPGGAGLRVAALGEGLRACPDWRATGLPRSSLMAGPAVWDGRRLVAAPLAGLANGYSAVIDHPGGDFLTSILTH